MDFVADGGLAVWFHDDDNLNRAFELMQRYADVPMDFADASVVRVLDLNCFPLDLDFNTSSSLRGCRHTWETGRPLLQSGVSPCSLSFSPWKALWIRICGKNITKRPKKFSLRRPICDGKDDVGECSTKIVFQSLPKINSSAMGIIRESTTAPRTEN